MPCLLTVVEQNHQVFVPLAFRFKVDHQSVFKIFDISLTVIWRQLWWKYLFHQAGTLAEDLRRRAGRGVAGALVAGSFTGGAATVSTGGAEAGTSTSAVSSLKIACRYGAITCDVSQWTISAM